TGTENREIVSLVLSMPLLPPAVPQAPVLGEISRPQVLTHGEQVTLSCQISGFYPKELSVTWLRRGRGAGPAVPLQGSAEYRIDPGAPHTQDGKSFQQETRLSFTPSVQRDQGAEYVCRVEHGALGTPLERHSGKLHVAGQFPRPHFSNELSSRLGTRVSGEIQRRAWHIGAERWGTWPWAFLTIWCHI
uniref:Ig-like domain-containing protein n=1 Tax=Terrapene triunguis TaxID=2587831 RepID=A0A674JZV8_9SAUR